MQIITPFFFVTSWFSMLSQPIRGSAVSLKRIFYFTPSLPELERFHHNQFLFEFRENITDAIIQYHNSTSNMHFIIYGLLM